MDITGWFLRESKEREEKKEMSDQFDKQFKAGKTEFGEPALHSMPTPHGAKDKGKMDQGQDIQDKQNKDFESGKTEFGDPRMHGLSKDDPTMDGPASQGKPQKEFQESQKPDLLARGHERLSGQ